jgi:hypothetical protein
MTEQILWATGTAVVVAFFTSVISQYVFAPTLEARKQRILERSTITSGIASELRALHVRLIEQRLERRMRISDLFSEKKDKPTFQEMATAFDPRADLSHAGLKPKLEALVLGTASAADIFSVQVPIRNDRFEPIVQLLHHTMNAIDPVNPPWTKNRHCRKGTKIYSKLDVPAREDFDGE